MPRLRTRKRSSKFHGARRGVGAIIGGVILAGIILTSVLTFFVTILQNEQARTSYEIQSQETTKDKDLETFIVDRDLTVTAGVVNLSVNNTGSIPMVVSHVLAYCSTCTNPGIPIQDQTISTVLNPGDTVPVTVTGLSTTGETYTISAISERGNIISSTTCTLTAGGGCTEDNEDGGATSADDIAQGTGSIQLDFKSYAAIFPDFKTRDSVDQTGKYTQSSDVKGYPGTNLYGDVNTIVVQRVRFINDENQELRLTKNTAFIAAFGGTKGNHPHLNYICSSSGDPVTIPLTTYNNDVLLEDVPAPYDQATGWHNVYFCRDSDNDGLPLGTIDGWKPNTDYSLGINPVFMVMRAKYEGSQIDYAQTIPYQAFQLNGATDGTITGLVACTFTYTSTPLGPINTCDAQTATATAGKPYDSQATAGSHVFVHVNSGTGSTSPYYVEWINHDGTSSCLSGVGTPCTSTTLNARNNIDITIPAGTAAGYYTIKVTDSSTANGTARVVFMTFRVT
jgi:hypothetical protein